MRVLVDVCTDRFICWTKAEFEDTLVLSFTKENSQSKSHKEPFLHRSLLRPSAEERERAPGGRGDLEASAQRPTNSISRNLQLRSYGWKQPRCYQACVKYCFWTCKSFALDKSRLSILLNMSFDDTDWLCRPLWAQLFLDLIVLNEGWASSRLKVEKMPWAVHIRKPLAPCRSWQSFCRRKHNKSA